MEVLAPRILADPDVDRWELWVNTQVKDDLLYLISLARNPKVRLIYSPAPYPDLPLGFRIHKFYPFATDPDCVYVRLDDDIVWYSPGAIGNLVKRRNLNPNPFLVYGNVLNSGLTSYWHQQLGRTGKDWGFATENCVCPVSWGGERFVVKLHRQFLDNPNPKN